MGPGRGHSNYTEIAYSMLDEIHSLYCVEYISFSYFWWCALSSSIPSGQLTLSPRLILSLLNIPD